jgi:hypothetical protein
VKLFKPKKPGQAIVANLPETASVAVFWLIYRTLNHAAQVESLNKLQYLGLGHSSSCRLCFRKRSIAFLLTSVRKPIMEQKLWGVILLSDAGRVKTLAFRRRL